MITIMSNFSKGPRRLSICGRIFGTIMIFALGAFSTKSASAEEVVANNTSAVTQAVLGIMSYVRWPSDPAELHLCVLADAAYAGGLLAASHRAANRPVTAKRIAIESQTLTSACHVAFVGRTSPAEHGRVFSRLTGLPVLTISEDDPSCSAGSMFCLTVGGGQISFQVNLDAIARSGLRVHPSVLRLGQRRGVSP
ncbi:YfiR family protein [Roseococcus sp.]|uniref:YfiR family protein n=1 Tax=Roseococcus sp. TaxID=2109646 RepID=UPI003BAC065E